MGKSKNVLLSGPGPAGTPGSLYLGTYIHKWVPMYVNNTNLVTHCAYRAVGAGRSRGGGRGQLLQLQTLVLKQQLQPTVQLSRRPGLSLQTPEPLHQTSYLPDRPGQVRSATPPAPSPHQPRHLPDKAGQVRSGQVRHSTRPVTSLPGHVRSGQVRSGQVRHPTRPVTYLPGQVRSGQVSYSTRPVTSLSGQVRSGQVRSLHQPRHLPARPGQVRSGHSNRLSTAALITSSTTFTVYQKSPDRTSFPGRSYDYKPRKTGTYHTSSGGPHCYSFSPAVVLTTK